jgi:hypothetical protein
LFRKGVSNGGEGGSLHSSEHASLPSSEHAGLPSSEHASLPSSKHAIGACDFRFNYKLIWFHLNGTKGLQGCRLLQLLIVSVAPFCKHFGTQAPLVCVCVCVC